MIASTKRYMTAFAAAALVAVAVSACGGGGGPPNNGPPPPPTYDDVDLSDLMVGFTTGAGSFTIEAGSHVDRGDVRFTCASGGEDCTVRVMRDDSGMITAESLSTGGMVTARDVRVIPPPKEDVDLSDVTPGFLADATMMLEIDAGESRIHGEIRFSCASGGEDCVVMVMVAGDGTITALSSGGTVTAMNSEDYGRRVSIREEIARLVEESFSFDPDSLESVLSVSSIAASGSDHLQLNQSHRTLYAFGAPWRDSGDGLNFTMSLDGEELPAGGAIVYLGRSVSGSPDDLVPMQDHGLGQISQIGWQVFSTTRDYDGVGTLEVQFVTDVEDTESPGQIWDGYGEGSDGRVILLDDVPILRAGHDWQGFGIGADETVTGSLDGVDGEFSCYMGKPCGLEITSDGATDRYDPYLGTVVFTPEPGSADPPTMFVTTTSASVTPVDYLSFGVWQYVPDDVDDSASFDFGVFAGGGDPFEPANGEALMGSATYVGDAIGMYSSRVTSDYLRDDPATSSSTPTPLTSPALHPVTGSFSADVTLTADFKTDTELGTLSGRVHEITYDNGRLHGDIYLREAPIDDPSTGVFGAIGGVASTSESGSSSVGGEWQAAFFGNDPSDPAIPHPTGVAGTFGVGSDGGGLVGAFGAHLQQTSP